MSTIEEERTTEAQLEAIEPSAPIREVTIGKGDYERTYLLRPLSFFQKMELIAVLGKALDEALSGENALSIEELLDVPDTRGEEISLQDIADADAFLKGIAKLAQYAPDLLAEIYCIALGIPRGRRLVAKEIMSQPEEEGGLSDELGFGILETFLNQNLGLLVDFFVQRLMPLVSRVAAATSPVSLKSSNPSAPAEETS